MNIETIPYPIRRIHQANLITLGKYKPLEEIRWEKVDLHHLFTAEHSTIEWVPIYIYEEDTRKDVTSHIVRHTKQHPRFVVQSGRPDWTGKERPPPTAPTQFMICANPLALISMARQRLCYKAMKETREWMERVTNHLLYPSLNNGALDYEQVIFFQSLGEHMVPDCVYRGQCCQKKSCGRYVDWDKDTLEERYKTFTGKLSS